MAFSIMCSSKKGVSALQLQRQLGLGSYRSAWHMAHRIREVAIENGVPVVEEPPLARQIHETAAVGEEVPPDLYQPVAKVLAFVYRAGGQREKAGVR